MSQRLLKGILSEDNSREDDLLVAFELFSILNMESPPRKSPPNQNHPESPRDRLNNYNSYYIYSPQNRKKCHESALPTSKKMTRCRCENDDSDKRVTVVKMVTWHLPMRTARSRLSLTHFAMCLEKFPGRSISPLGVLQTPTKKFVLLLLNCFENYNSKTGENFRWLKLKHYWDRDESSNSHLGGAMFYHLKWKR